MLSWPGEYIVRTCPTRGVAACDAGICNMNTLLLDVALS